MIWRYDKIINENFSKELKKELLKQAMKEYVMTKSNSSVLDWFEDEEEM